MFLQECARFAKQHLCSSVRGSVNDRLVPDIAVSASLCRKVSYSHPEAKIPSITRDRRAMAMPRCHNRRSTGQASSPHGFVAHRPPPKVRIPRLRVVHSEPRPLSLQCVPSRHIDVRPFRSVEHYEHPASMRVRPSSMSVRHRICQFLRQEEIRHLPRRVRHSAVSLKRLWHMGETAKVRSCRSITTHIET